MIKHPRDVVPGDFVYSHFHRANVMVLRVTLETADKPKDSLSYMKARISTAGFGAPVGEFLCYNPSAPTLYHKNVAPSVWADVGEI